MNYPVQVTHIKAEFERTGGDDDAVLLLGEGVFGCPALLTAERTVRNECLDFSFTQKQRKLFNPGSAVTEHEPLFALMQQRNHLGRILKRTDVIQLDDGGLPCGRCRRNHLPLPLRPRRQPRQHLGWVADRGRQPDPLQITPRQSMDSAEKDREKMPAPVVPGERMEFIDHDGSDVLKELTMVNLGGHQNGFVVISAS